MTDFHNYEHKLGLCLKLVDRKAFPDEDDDEHRLFPHSKDVFSRPQLENFASYFTGLTVSPDRMIS